MKKLTADKPASPDPAFRFIKRRVSAPDKTSMDKATPRGKTQASPMKSRGEDQENQGGESGSNGFKALLSRRTSLPSNPSATPRRTVDQSQKTDRALVSRSLQNDGSLDKKEEGDISGARLPVLQRRAAALLQKSEGGGGGGASEGGGVSAFLAKVRQSGQQGSGSGIGDLQAARPATSWDMKGLLGGTRSGNSSPCPVEGEEESGRPRTEARERQIHSEGRPPPGSPSKATSHWNKLRTHTQVASQLKNVVKPSNNPQTPSASNRRNEYSKNVLLPGLVKVYVRTERGMQIKIQDLRDLKTCFDEIDVSGDGIISLAEVSANKRKRREQMVVKDPKDDLMKLLLTIERDMTFPEVLKKCYPFLSKVDIKQCVVAVSREKLGLHDDFDDVKVVEKVSVWSDLLEVFDLWKSYSRNGAFINLDSFQTMMSVIEEETPKHTVVDIYDTIADPVTGRLTKKDFSMWWINKFRRGRQLLFTDVKDEYEKFWRKYDQEMSVW